MTKKTQNTVKIFTYLKRLNLTKHLWESAFEGCSILQNEL